MSDMKINGKTKVYGIIGNPVSHSLSPLMHNGAFAELGENSVYIPLPVKHVEEGIIGLKGLGLFGASVTIPHKEAVIPLLDKVDPVAAKIGAVNTIVAVEADDRMELHGFNTDWIGANKALQVEIDLNGKKIVLLGAGGSAKAIGFGLLEAGAEVILCSRTPNRGKALAAELGCKWFSLDSVNELSGDILVNATSVGMAPDSGETLVDKSVLGNYKVVMDIVYSPLKTRLLQEAEEEGCTIVNGLEMLLYQGVAQFEFWTGKSAPVDSMRKMLMSATGN